MAETEGEASLMAVRIRSSGEIVCAAAHQPETDDTYLHDGLHYRLSVELGALVTEPMDLPDGVGRGGHRRHGQWWWANEVPSDAVIEERDWTLIGRHRQEFLDGCAERGMTDAEARACLTDFEADLRHQNDATETASPEEGMVEFTVKVRRDAVHQLESAVPGFRERGVELVVHGVGSSATPDYLFLWVTLYDEERERAYDQSLWHGF